MVFRQKRKMVIVKKQHKITGSRILLSKFYVSQQLTVPNFFLEYSYFYLFEIGMDVLVQDDSVERS